MIRGATVAATMLLLLGGCGDDGYESAGPETTPVVEEPARTEPAPRGNTGGLGNQGNSTLGKARNAAQSTVDKLGERQAELERELDGG